MKVKLEWKPQDAWIGLYTEKRDVIRHIWICLLPCVPIHIQFNTRRGRIGDFTFTEEVLPMRPRGKTNDHAD